MAASTPTPSPATGFWQWLRRSTGSAPKKPTPAAPATAKQQRAANREQLFGVVRENMIRAGVLSSTYKFKVLTLDPAGQQFIVMVDWQPGAAHTDGATHQTLEMGLQQLAQERLGFRIKAVYWRHTGGEAPRQPTTAATPVAAPAPRTAQVDLHAVSDDELLAFRAALRSPSDHQAPAKTSKKADPRQGDAADFQPTVITDDAPGTDFGALSETQYGPLR